MSIHEEEKKTEVNEKYICLIQNTLKLTLRETNKQRDNSKNNVFILLTHVFRARHFSPEKRCSFYVKSYISY